MQRALVAALAPAGCALYADSFDLLMAPIEEIISEHEHCSWANPIDLPVTASTSSDFEAEIEIREDECGNRLLMMGGMIQCHSVDEFIYHEMMVHPAFSTFFAQNGRAPAHVFLGGSGDGAGPREVLRWRNLRNATMVDIDFEVTRFSLEWIPSLARGSFEDPRLHLVTGDAWGWLQGSNDIFDVIILDFPDAFDNVMLEKLYSQEFYRLCRAHMHAGSVLVAQTGPCTQVARSGFRAQCPVLESLILANMAAVFEDVETMLHPMATWKPERRGASEWSSFTLARMASSPALAAAADGEPWRDEIDGVLRYYSRDVHVAALDHPRPLVFRLQSLARKEPPAQEEL
ncbi:unnamed protein product [Effrenium voratum]|nr:unnamed protein product [Effrenium voratum]